MKKIKFTMLALLTCVSMTNAQTTATDFTENDCNGVSHHLFSEMDAGKIIVVAFVMPCGSCAAPSLAAYNAVQSYATSNPGRILFYLADDYGTTTCSTLSSWGNTNGMHLATSFSTTSFVQSQYGASGMPKIVVLGGTDHEILFNANDGVNVSTIAVQAVIDAELLAQAGAKIEEIESSKINLKISPNPVKDNINLEYTLTKNSTCSFEIYAINGTLIQTIVEKNVTEGTHSKQFNNLNSGSYILKLKTETENQYIQFVVE